MSDTGPLEKALALETCRTSAVIGLLYAVSAMVGPDLQQHWGALLVALLLFWSGTCAALVVLRSSRSGALFFAALGAAGAWLGATAYDPQRVAHLLLTIGTLMTCGFVLAFASLRFYRRPRPLRLLSVPLVTIMLGAEVLLVGALAYPSLPALPATPMPPDDELRYLHLTESADWRTGLALLNSQRDRARQNRVLELSRSGYAQTAEARFYGAAVLQHSACPEHRRRAAELAREAARQGFTGAVEWHRPSGGFWSRLLDEHSPLPLTAVWGIDGCEKGDVVALPPSPPREIRNARV